MTITDAAVNGIHQAESLLNSTAAKVTRQTDVTTPASDEVSLSAAAVALIEARTAVAVSVSAIHAADDMQKTLLRLLS